MSPVLLRGIVLFSVGVIFSLVYRILQVQKSFPLLSPHLVPNVVYTAWWLPTICGSASALVGLLYPCIDRKFGKNQTFHTEWASVMRCVALFLGINHASAKVDFASNMQLSLTLGAMSIALWWLFDRTRRGLGLGLGSATLAIFVAQLLIYNGISKCTENDYLHMRSWLPCAFFSGGITVGNIGRRLAMVDQRFMSSIRSHGD